MTSGLRFGVRLVWAAVLALGVAGPASANGSVKVLRTVPYAEGAFVRPEVRSQCPVPTQLPEFLRDYAAKNGIDVQLVDALPTNGTDRVLQLEIAETVEQGNAWTGRYKGLVITGKLVQGGQELGSFRGRRTTTGGAFGGYKGNCAFFSRCAKTLGNDVARWLKAPTPNAMLGQ
jgi:hypothetical protein